MQRICLVVVGMYLNLLSAFSQNSMDSAYQSRKLKVEEINLVSSYYHQDGNGSAVTGGIGTEKLTDFANVIDVKLTKYDQRLRKHSLTLEAGVDAYTSASSDKIDLKANSSASSHDIRVYPSITWTVENENKGTTFGLNASSSTEFDYQSFGFGISGGKKSKNNNRELSFKAQAFLDQVSLVTPTELRASGGNNRERDHYGTAARNSYSGSISLSQIVNKRLQLMLMLDVVKQDGFLSLPFHRVYFTDNTLKTELLPSSRMKIPMGFRANYFFGDKIILRSFYRYYLDDWGLKSHTADLEASVKLTPFFSITPFYRFYNQTAVKYFAEYQKHLISDQFYTSNHDLSDFNSNFFGAGIRSTPPKGVFGLDHFSMLEIRYGHYNRSNGLNSDIISLNLKFK
jgi:hypothetical protein